MRQRPFGRLGTASALTLGGGGIAGIWGETTREECVATVREAVDSGIDVLDLAPSYGNGEAEEVIGEAFGGASARRRARHHQVPRRRHPARTRSTTTSRNSLKGSLERMRLDHVDVMFVHNAITLESEGHERLTPASVVAEAVAPAFERLIAEGRVRHWGLTGIGEPDALIHLLNNGPRPDYVQCIANLLDSPGGLLRGGIAARPRDIIADANANGTAVMGIRAVQAGALTDAIDRPLPDGHSELADYDRAAPFRAIAAEVGRSAAWLAHCYALSMDGIGTVVLGVKNRQELRECIDAEAASPMDASLIARIDAAVGRTDLT